MKIKPIHPHPTTAPAAEPPAGPSPHLTEKTNLGLQPVTPAQPPVVIETQPLPAPAVAPHKARRRGRVASLPQIHRDLVGRMLANGVPYKNIVGALDECGFTLTERNVSSWVTGGGYAEWQLEQELVLQNRLDQDHLVAHLRRDDASELPEVGLQAAATRISQILLQKTARAENLDLAALSQMVDLLSRLTHEITLLQKQRDDSRRSLGRAHDPARIKEMDETSALAHERYCSYPDEESELKRPAEAPFLPPEPTSDFLAQQDREAEDERKLPNMDNLIATLTAMNGKNPSAASPKPLPTPAPARQDTVGSPQPAVVSPPGTVGCGKVQ
jgi:hypothetical protein